MFEFIRQMPNARWDETRVLNAEFGDHVTVAKRHGRDWFVVIDESGVSTSIWAPRHTRQRSTRTPRTRIHDQPRGL